MMYDIGRILLIQEKGKGKKSVKGKRIAVTPEKAQQDSGRNGDKTPEQSITHLCRISFPRKEPSFRHNGSQNSQCEPGNNRIDIE